MVGEKVAIVSDKPADHAPRDPRRGHARRTGSSCWSTCPGVQRPRDPLTERMQHADGARAGGLRRRAVRAQRRAGVGPGDRFIANAISEVGAARGHGGQQDRPPRPRPHGRGARRPPPELDVQGEIFPISARTGERGGGAGSSHLVALLPEGPFLYPPEEHTDLSEEVRLAELIREQVLLRTREEMPHAVEVEVEEIEEREDGLLMVRGPAVGRDRVPEGDPDRRRAAGWCARSAPPRARRSRRSMGATCTWTSACACAGWRRDEALLDRLGIE